MLTLRKQSGFTIVELLIVIVIIAVLAATSVVAYGGVQSRARNTKIDSDLALLDKAIQMARVNSDKVLYGISGSGCSGCVCRDKPVGTDLAALDKATDSCWTGYRAALQAITNASGSNVMGLVDPYGRPYDIDENEGVSILPCGTGRDVVAAYQPGTTNWVRINLRYVPYMTPGC